MSESDKDHKEISLFETLFNFIFAFGGFALYGYAIWLVIKGVGYIMNILATSEVGRFLIAL